jgi:hypothetical protein
MIEKKKNMLNSPAWEGDRPNFKISKEPNQEEFTTERG